MCVGSPQTFQEKECVLEAPVGVNEGMCIGSATTLRASGEKRNVCWKSRRYMVRKEMCVGSSTRQYSRNVVLEGRAVFVGMCVESKDRAGLKECVLEGHDAETLCLKGMCIGSLRGLT